MSWPEVSKAAEEQRYELVLNGTVISERIASTGIDSGIFALTKLNFLQISNTALAEIPNEIGNLLHLKTLDLHRNAIQSIPSSIGLLQDLKTLDLSGNSLKNLPDEIGEIESLHTFNLNCNKLTSVPSLEKAKHLARLDLSHNELTSLPDGIFKLEFLSEFKASHNSIGCLGEDVSSLQALKVLDMSYNKIIELPASLANCFKLKDLNLKENQIKDNRLTKLINQCSTKAILDYVASNKEKGKGKKGGKKSRMRNVSESEQAEQKGPVIKVVHGERIKVVVTPSVLEVRPYIVCTLVKNLDLADMAKFKKFIAIQVMIVALLELNRLNFY